MPRVSFPKLVELTKIAPRHLRASCFQGRWHRLTVANIFRIVRKSFVTNGEGRHNDEMELRGALAEYLRYSARMP